MYSSYTHVSEDILGDDVLLWSESKSSLIARDRRQCGWRDCRHGATRCGGSWWRRWTSCRASSTSTRRCLLHLTT